MENYFDNNDWPEIEDDHVEPYQYAVCLHCEGAIKLNINYVANSMEWEHVMDGERDHAAEVGFGSFDMFPPATIAAAIGHAVEHYNY
jgi:hypothetical protein